MKKKILMATMLMTVFVFSAGIANATQLYLLGVSSVDAGEIRWGGSTTYSIQWNAGISTWNALNKISIAPDTIYTYEDLRVSDVNNSALAWYGYYTPYNGTDTIQFNIYYLSSKTSAEKQYTTTHELGHSLGLGHSIFGNIMNGALSPQTSLGAHDVSDYRYLWGY